MLDDIVHVIAVGEGHQRMLTESALQRTTIPSPDDSHTKSTPQPRDVFGSLESHVV
jgi:hypothetical protein